MADQPTPTATPAAPSNQDPAPSVVTTPPSSSDVKPVEEPKVEEKTVPLSRFSEVNAELKKFKDEKAAADQKALEDQGKYKELADAATAKADAAEARAREAVMQSQVALEATKLGIVDADAAVKLVNRDSITFDDNGNVSGVDAALKQLVEDKPYLVTKDSVTRVGSGSNPGDGNNQSPTATTIKKSQMQDPKFYKEHRTEILKAVANGNVIDDTI